MVEPAIPYLDTADLGMKDGQNGKFMVGRGARRFDFAGTVTRRVRSAADCGQKRGF
jgi:hypothetical protein